MRALVLRAIAWMLLASFATTLLGEIYSSTIRFNESKGRISMMMELCLEDTLITLDNAPVHARPQVLEAEPRLLQIATLVERDALPSTLKPNVVNSRPIWAERGTFWFGLSNNQLLSIQPVTAPGRYYLDPVFLLSTVLGMSTLVSVAIVLPVARRLRRLTQASRRVAMGDLSTRVNDPQRDAIGELACQFDVMTEAIDQQQREREAFFHAIAHELGTPLSRMELSLTLLSSARAPDDRQRHTQALQREVDELSSLTTELLDWVREERSVTLKPEHFDPIVVLDDLIARNQQEGVTLTRTGIASAELWGELRGFNRALDNIIRNAVYYAASEVRVTVTRDDALDITIEDDGPGIAPADRERIFEPFTRLDPSRNRSSGGSGLGLSIVKRILDRHHGQIWVSRSAQLGGAAFVIRWQKPGTPPAV
ncbi:MAG: ATP-binding protein [Myxococcota bacterium]